MKNKEYLIKRILHYKRQGFRYSDMIEILGITEDNLKSLSRSISNITMRIINEYKNGTLSKLEVEEKLKEVGYNNREIVQLTE